MLVARFMTQKWLPIALIISIAFIGGCLDTSGTLDKGLKVQVNGQQALEIVHADPEAAAFIEENFFNESERITDVQLNWITGTTDYVWYIRITERECGCRGIEGLNVLEAEVDPTTGALLDLNARVGLDEEAFARETCEKACHEE